MSSTSLGAVNAGDPESSSYNTLPALKTSLCPLSLSSPWACSGDMYRTLPLMIPCAVRSRSTSALAMPKSMIFTEPS